jgi:hypothetical protein
MKYIEIISIQNNPPCGADGLLASQEIPRCFWNSKDKYAFRKGLQLRRTALIVIRNILHDVVYIFFLGYAFFLHDMHKLESCRKDHVCSFLCYLVQFKNSGWILMQFNIRNPQKNFTAISFFIKFVVMEVAHI